MSAPDKPAVTTTPSTPTDSSKPPSESGNQSLPAPSSGTASAPQAQPGQSVPPAAHNSPQAQSNSLSNSQAQFPNSTASEPPGLPELAGNATPADFPEPGNTHGPRRVGKRLVKNPVNKKHGKRMSPALYESLWEAWRDGQRNKSELCRMFQLSWDTLDRVVNGGYPGMPALKERLIIYEADKTRLAQEADIAAMTLANQEYVKARKINLEMINGVKASLVHLVRKAVPAAQVALFSRVKRMRSKDGTTWVDVDVPANAFEVADALKTITGALRELGVHESLWMGGPTERTAEGEGTAKPLTSLTDEQLDYVLQNGGALPPGVTDEMLFGRAPGGPPTGKNN